MVFPERACTQQAPCRPKQIQLNYRPNPKTAQWWGLLHLGIVPPIIDNIYEIAAGTYTAYGEERLVEDGLYSRRESGEEN